jgi:crossover junction endodeoxyribonuclease RuvC
MLKPTDKILFLDLATVTGHCFGAPGETPIYGSYRIGRPGCELGEFLAIYIDWLSDRITVFAPDAIAFEAPILTAGKTDIQTARKLMSLSGCTELIAYRREIPAREVDNATIKKWFAGHGRADKNTMVRACVALGFDPRGDHNTADAIAGWSYACSIAAPKLRQRRYDGALLGAGA